MTAVEKSVSLPRPRLVRRLPGLGADSQTVLSGLLRIADCVVVMAAALVAYWLRTNSFSLPGFYLTAALLGVLLTANYMQLLGVYRFENLRRPAIQLGKVVAGWLFVIATLLALSYFTSTSVLYSRIWGILWLSLTLPGFVLLRAVATVRIARWKRAGLLSVRVAVVGTGDLARRVARQLAQSRDGDHRIVGFFDVGAESGNEIDGIPLQGGIEALLGEVRENQIDEILVALPWTEEGTLDRLLRRLSAAPVTVRLCPDLLLLNHPVRRMTTIGGMPTLDVYERPLSGWNQVLKKLEDRILGVVILFVALPVLAAIALAIRLDSPGPVLFRQRRYGFNNNEFTLYKFRTMRHAPGPEGEVPQATRNDARVTRVGNLLRRTSLDELPQLINVLKGDMSLVGPRPHAVAHNKHYAALIDEYLGRHKVKPGITGWAQVNGLRGETRTPEEMRLRVQYDLYYVDNWSLLFDLKILFLTLFVGFVHEKAY